MTWWLTLDQTCRDFLAIVFSLSFIVVLLTTFMTLLALLYRVLNGTSETIENGAVPGLLERFWNWMIRYR